MFEEGIVLWLRVIHTHFLHMNTRTHAHTHAHMHAQTKTTSNLVSYILFINIEETVSECFETNH